MDLRIFRLFAVVFAFALFLTGCAEEAGAPIAEEGAVEEEEDVEPVEPLIGQQLNVSGEVSSVLEPGAFVISGQDFGFGADAATGPGTLILDAQSPPATVEEGGVAEVVGEVVRVVIPDIENEFGFDFNDELLVDFEGELAIVASAVDFIPTGEDEEPGVELGDDEEEPVLAPGETVALGGSIDTVLTPFAFVLHTEETDEDVLVLDSGGAPITDLEEGAAAQVRGDVVQFVIAEIENDLGVDLDDELFAEFEQQHAVMASAVQIVPTE